MGRSWWAKFALLVFSLGMSVVYVYPTLSGLNPETTKFPFKQKVNLGLDLQGGLYLVLGVDFNKVFKDVVTRQAASVSGRFKEKSFSTANAEVVTANLPSDDPHLTIAFDAGKRDAAYDVIKKEYWVLRLVSEKPGSFELGLTREYRQEVRDKTINQSIEVIRNRIDEFGVSEPAIASQGTDRVVVELPGVREVDRAKDLIGRTARLEFKIVDDSKSPQELSQWVTEAEKKGGFAFKEGEKFSEYVRKVNEALKGKLPEGREIAFERGKGEEAQMKLPYLLNTHADVTGDDLQDAVVGFGERQEPVVNFTFNPKGAVAFEKLTTANKKKRLAIVLDNIVHSAPVINGPIGARGQITLGQRDYEHTMKEARDLAIVLRAGALPAQLEFLEQRVVGPSLGQDSIKKGATASLVGSLLVFMFVLFYYRVSGAIAVVSLVFNVLLVIASLVGLEATLTLPGIAGIALTVGIAVDSNVVVYERIREELRLGKRPRAAVDSGFQKAFRTIFDANVTNAAAAVVLLLYGTGPIKGFAVSLLIGIVTTLFTAVFVCKVLFDAYLRVLERRDAATISI